MNSTYWPRLGAVAGLLFVVLLVVSAVVVAQPPAHDASAAEVKAYYVDHADGVRFQAFLNGGLAAACFLLYLAGLRVWLRRIDDADDGLATTAFAGGIIVLAAIVPVVAIRAGLAYGIAEQVDAAVVKGLFDLGYVIDTFTVFPTAVLLGAASVAGRQSNALPGWLTWAGLGLAGLQLISGLDLLIGGYSSLGVEGVFGFPMFVLFLVWIVATSVVMLRRGSVVRPGAAIARATTA